MKVYGIQVLVKILIYIGVAMLLISGQSMFYQELSIRTHILIIILHLISLIGVLSFGFFKKDILGLVYMVFLVMKMGAFLYLFYQKIIPKEHIFVCLGIYFVYLVIETILIISLIQKTNKTHKNLN